MDKQLLLALITCVFVFSFKNNRPVHGEDPATGLFLNVKNKQPYGLFFKAVKSEHDRPFFKVEGNIYDDDDVFTICPAAKADAPYLPGNVLTISNIEMKIRAKGCFDICPEIKSLGFKVAGTANASLKRPLEKGSEIDPDDLTIDWVAGFDFNLPRGLMKIMLADFSQRPPNDTTTIHYADKPAFITALKEWNTKEKRQIKALAELRTGAPFKLSAEDTPATFTIGQLLMKWNAELQSFTTISPKAILVNIDKTYLHCPIEALAEFNMPAHRNDQLRLLITSPNGHYYFFNYMNGLLQTCSDNQAYNDLLINMKEKDLSVEVVKGQPYELQSATASVVHLFRKRINAKPESLK